MGAHFVGWYNSFFFLDDFVAVHIINARPAWSENSSRVDCDIPFDSDTQDSTSEAFVHTGMDVPFY